MTLESGQPGDAERLSSDELRDAWMLMTPEERADGLMMLGRRESEDFFLNIGSHEQHEVLLGLPLEERRSWMRLMAPDDAADLLQAGPIEHRVPLLALLDEPTRHEVSGLLAYAEDDAGGLMNPRFARVRPDMSVDEAIGYLRKQAREQLEMLRYLYVLDEQQHLLGVVSLRNLFIARPEQTVRDLMATEPVSVRDDADQEAVSLIFSQRGLAALPVVDAEQRVVGIVTMDDIVDVMQEEATEDIQKYGGMEALELPYLGTSFFTMIKKRGGWLAVLFLGELLTATAMAHFEDEIAKAVVLAMFVPLIISSGGNSGSQASTLVIRAMALGEVKLRDWWRVAGREVAAGLTLGMLLGSIGFLRILIWQSFSPIYGEHYVLIAATVFASLVGVVLFGTVAGSLLPFALRRLGFDPASASAPFVATLVDVSGLVIYFTVASVILGGTLL